MVDKLKKELLETLKHLNKGDECFIVCNDYYFFYVTKKSDTEFKFTELYSSKSKKITIDEIYDLLKKHKGFLSEKKEKAFLANYEMDEEDFCGGDTMELFCEYCYERYSNKFN